MARAGVIAYSGGLDSTTLLYDFKRQNIEVSALTIKYGQHNAKELACAIRNCEKLGVEQKLIDLAAARELFGNSRLVAPEQQAPASFLVPNRNMVFLALAGAWAISRGAEFVAYAPHADDADLYPDCRREFAARMSGALQVCHHRPLMLLAPYLDKSKADVVRLAAEFGVAFENTWSCYEEFDEACGECEGCRQRAQAFTAAGITDPLLPRIQKREGAEERWRAA